MQKIIAIDAGGTSSRAVLLDASGACSGFGRAGAGNPTAVGIDAAVDALGLAAERALGGAVARAEPDSLVVISLAGTATPPFLTLLDARLAALGLRGQTVIEPDLLGTFCSGTAGADGYVVIAGTGAIAARISDRYLHTVRGGSGWLVGDTGSGFWIGQQVARAVVASLDGLTGPTALTPLLLAAMGIDRTGARSRGRPEELSRALHAIYALRPVELAQFAPLAFTAIQADAGEDAVARGILEAAAAAIARVLVAAIDPDVSGVVVLGGSVLAAGLKSAPEIFAHPLRLAAGDTELIPVEDGVVGAAVLALRHLGLEVDTEFHRWLTAEIRRVRTLG